MITYIHNDRVVSSIYQYDISYLMYCFISTCIARVLQHTVFYMMCCISRLCTYAARRRSHLDLLPRNGTYASGLLSTLSWLDKYYIIAIITII